MASVRSLSTVAPSATLRWNFTSKPIRPSMPRIIFMTRARPRTIGSPDVLVGDVIGQQTFEGVEVLVLQRVEEGLDHQGVVGARHGRRLLGHDHQPSAALWQGGPMRVAVVAGPDPGHAFPAIALCLKFLAAGDDADAVHRRRMARYRPRRRRGRGRTRRAGRRPTATTTPMPGRSSTGGPRGWRC